MHKKIIVIILLICISFSLSAISVEGYAPYEEGEFPHWSIKLRRAECIFFGGIPLVYPFVSLACNQFGTQVDIPTMILASCGIAAVITVTDFILGEIKNDN